MQSLGLDAARAHDLKVINSKEFSFDIHSHCFPQLHFFFPFPKCPFLAFYCITRTLPGWTALSSLLIYYPPLINVTAVPKRKIVNKSPPAQVRRVPCTGRRPLSQTTDETLRKDASQINLPSIS